MENDDNVFTAVEKFAAKYGFRRITLSDILDIKTPEEKEQYVISHEWTDGDQLTFFIRKLKDNDKDYDENTCAASVDDWEPNRPEVICKRLYDACILHGILPPPPRCS